MNKIKLKQYLINWFRIWQVMFISYLLIFGIASFGGYKGDVIFNSLFNSLLISSVYFLLTNLRNDLILYAKRLESNIKNSTQIGYKVVDKALENYDKEQKKEDEME